MGSSSGLIGQRFLKTKWSELTLSKGGFSGDQIGAADWILHKFDIDFRSRIFVGVADAVAAHFCASLRQTVSKTNGGTMECTICGATLDHGDDWKCENKKRFEIQTGLDFKVLVGRWVDPLREKFMVKTSDYWAPNFPDDMVEVTVYWFEPGETQHTISPWGRICVSGMDDTRMEQDFKDRQKMVDLLPWIKGGGVMSFQDFWTWGSVTNDLMWLWLG